MKKKATFNYSRYGYYFVAPFIIIFVIFQLYPIVYTLNLSITDLTGWATEYKYVGLQNFIRLFQSKLFIQSLKNTVIIWGVNFIPQLGIALLLAAWFTDIRMKVKGQGIFKVLFYLPGIITAASIAVLFSSLFRFPDGVINNILVSAGILETPFEFFRSKTATRLLVSFIQFWMFYGSTMIMLIAAILGINPALYEAAMIDGASNKKIFFSITLPLIKPIMLYILVTSLIGGMQMFDIPFLITNRSGSGSPDNAITTVAIFIYNQAFTGGRNFNIASAASVILLGIIIIGSRILFRIFKEE